MPEEYNPWTISYIEDTDPLSPTFGQQVPVYLYSPVTAPSQPSGQDVPNSQDSLGSTTVPAYARLGTVRRTGATEYKNTLKQGVRVEDEAVVHHYSYDFDTQLHTYNGFSSSRPKFTTLITPATINGTSWVDAVKAKVADGDFAKFSTVGGFTEQLVMSDFDVSNIPDGARILGITIRVRRRAI